ncbi:hypothetical protein HII31_03634 [Pseudocercospora fuligena]|uniref:BTB domain-containing protein n=1 Tax=Pseudocercospora fuligena TaxID=685502 RepID=A0A8H6VQA2_9PEZI|nr:hypothetical protein HII31_03634 [Pseudocercospora fuligena]
MSKKHFFEKLKDTRADHDTSDFTIVCSGKDIKVHRLVLSLHSGYFARLFKSDFKENVESKITLVKEPFAAVVAMIQFFYELTYDGISSIQEHATVWILGDKFEIPGLMEYAQKRFDNACKASVESYEMDLTIATPLIEVVPLIYENTPPNTVGLRATVAKWWNELMCWNRYIISKDEWREMITKHPEFGVDVITRLGMD